MIWDGKRRANSFRVKKILTIVYLAYFKMNHFIYEICTLSVAWLYIMKIVKCIFHFRVFYSLTSILIVL